MWLLTVYPFLPLFTFNSESLIDAKFLIRQIMFLKDRVMAEQFDKENTEKILQLDLDQARQEIGM